MSDDVESEFLRRNRAHDPAWLIDRWHEVARAGGLDLRAFAAAAEHDIFVLRPRAARPGARRVYLSAGMHGDEPAGTLGLLEWARANTAVLRRLDVLIFPCFNPWGLENNRREDARGRDLNRLFQSRASPLPAWRRELGTGRFDIAISLHEDFDAHGAYIYELGGRDGERLLAAAAAHIPPDPSSQIDGRVAVGGVIRYSGLTPENFPLPGLPEAVWLYFERCGHSITFETPSEFSLHRRVAAHAAVLSAALCEAG